MSFDILLTIKDYRNRGGDLTLKLWGVHGEQMVTLSRHVTSKTDE